MNQVYLLYSVYHNGIEYTRHCDIQSNLENSNGTYDHSFDIGVQYPSSLFSYFFISLIAYSLLQYKATLVDPIYLFHKQLFYFPN